MVQLTGAKSCTTSVPSFIIIWIVPFFIISDDRILHLDIEKSRTPALIVSITLDRRTQAGRNVVAVLATLNRRVKADTHGVN